MFLPILRWLVWERSTRQICPLCTYPSLGDFFVFYCKLSETAVIFSACFCWVILKCCGDQCLVFLAGFVATMRSANLFQVSNQLARPVTIFLGCLEACLEKSCLFLLLLFDTYPPLAILAAYFSGRGGQHGTDSLFNLDFASEDRRLVCLRCFRFGYLCLRPTLESVLNSEYDSLSVLVDVLQLLLEDRGCLWCLLLRLEEGLRWRALCLLRE